VDEEAERVRSVYEAYGRSSRRARSWSPANPGNRLIREEIVAAIRAAAPGLPDAPGDVLDVGCGTGWWLRELAASGVPARRLHGVDLLPSRVEAVRRALPEAHVDVGDARALPWPDGRFWLVTMFLVLSSEDTDVSQRRSLAEARRVLAPGGHLFVWEPRVPNPANRATRRVRARTVRRALGPRLEQQPVTVLPALARRLARSADDYARLRRTGILCTHRLWHLRG
jgi:ubiquinone/menaquinone biosynthesis C-methylase UbiE